MADALEIGPSAYSGCVFTITSGGFLVTGFGFATSNVAIDIQPSIKEAPGLSSKSPSLPLPPQNHEGDLLVRSPKNQDEAVNTQALGAHNMGSWADFLHGGFWYFCCVTCDPSSSNYPICWRKWIPFRPLVSQLCGRRIRCVA